MVLEAEDDKRGLELRAAIAIFRNHAGGNFLDGSAEGEPSGAQLWVFTNYNCCDLTSARCRILISKQKTQTTQLEIDKSELSQIY